MSLTPDELAEMREQCDFLFNEDGTVNAEAALTEMFDYYELAKRMSELVYNITNGRMSKPNYLVSSIMSVHEDVIESLLQQAQHEAVQRAFELILEGKTPQEVLDAFPPDDRLG